MDDRAILRVLRACLAAGYLGLTPNEHPVPFIMPLGSRVMREEVPNEVVLRRDVERRPASSKRERAPKSSSASATVASQPPELQARFDALRRARAELAKEAGVPAYVVAHDSALLALATDAPQTLAEMTSVKGWGETKVARFGKRLLEVLGSNFIN